MSMWIKGELSDSDLEQLKTHFTSILSRADGDEYDGVNYEKGWSDLYSAVDLLNLLSSEKGRKLDRLLKAEIESNRDEEGAYTITIEQARRILELMEGLDESLSTLVDENWQIRPERLDYVLRKDPHLAVGRKQANGMTVYTLDESIGKMEAARWFLQQALRLNREVKIG